MTNTARDTDFENFHKAANALGAELGATDCAVFRDTDTMWSAVLTCPGRNAPQTIEEDGFTARLQYTVTLAKTFGFDSVGVMVDVFNEAATLDTRVTDIETRGADVLDSVWERVGVQPGV